MHNKKNEIKVASDYWESLTVARDLEENGVDTLYGYYGENEEYRVAFSNNTSYLYEVAHIKESLTKGPMNFALFLVDINGLKKVNDVYGHQFGNKLIVETTNILVQVFGHDNVYRIGGDEFSVILKNTTEEFCQTLVERFYKEIAEKMQDIKISVAMGFGNYDSAIDESYESFFKRIDEEMYHNKKKMKALGEILN